MLKIDLLPRHFAIARTNRKLIILAILVLIGIVGFWFFKLNSINTQMAETEEKLAVAKKIADEVRELESNISEKQGLLDPIQGKVDFVKQADESGGQFWDRFHAINEYIWSEAQMTDFAISGSNQVEFTVTVRGTLGVGRFLLNLLRCPAITNITYSGMPGGAGAVGAGGGAGRPAAGAPMMGPGMGMMRPGMMGPGMMGQVAPQGPATVAGGEPGSPNEAIPLRISATLIEPITIPQPPRAAAEEAEAGMAEGMMRPGMMPPEGMPPEGGRPQGMPSGD